MEKERPQPLYVESPRELPGPTSTKRSTSGTRPPLSPRLPYRGRPMARRAAAVLLLAALLFIHLHAQNRESLLAKYRPTIFNTNSLHAYHIDGKGVDGKGESRVLDYRSEWVYLGGGREGDVFAYEDLAIKVYDEGRSPARNCVPGTGDSWPTEIPASLLAGNGSMEEAFVQVVDYFFSGDGDEGRWHLVTPFYEDGALEDLARKVREHNLSAREVDEAYRPSLVRLLDALGELHEVHGLCHDDIKPGNIFVGPDSGYDGVSGAQWLLSDLGNARHVGHPYHTSALWEGKGQLVDCRANDMLRLLKSYVHFLRNAVDDKMRFNEEFVGGCEEWSCIYWRAAGALRAGRTAGVRGIVGPGSGAWSESGCSAEPVLAGRFRGSLEGAVMEELELRMGDQWARFWGLAAVRGVPTMECGQ